MLKTEKAIQQSLNDAGCLATEIALTQYDSSALSNLEIRIELSCAFLYDAAKHGGIAMEKKYIVRLTDEERNALCKVVKKLKGTSQKSAAGTSAAEGGRRWTEPDRQKNCRCVFLSNENRGKYTPAVSDGWFQDRTEREKARYATATKTARRTTGSQGDRTASGCAPKGVRKLVVASSCRASGGTGNRGFCQP